METSKTLCSPCKVLPVLIEAATAVGPPVIAQQIAQVR
jgi:hypothetical protein